MIFYIFFELRLIPILVIILSLGRQPERLSAGSYLFFYTTIISVPYLIIILLIDSIFFKSQNFSIRISLGLIIILVPFLIKIPVFGFHF